jgi:thioredoxin reductase (NADPH)
MSLKKEQNELVIIGLGPAGLSASIYASRYGLRHLILGQVVGGQISETHEIDNYLSLPSLSGIEFGQRGLKHLKKYKEAQVIFQKVEKIKKRGDLFQIILKNKENIITKRLLLTLGVEKRKLNIIDEKKFVGKGVSYCATCDGFFYKNKTVAVVGGSDSAVGAAVFLGDIAKKVFIIYRGEELRAENYWLRQIRNNSKIEVIYGANIKKIIGKNKVEKIELDNKKRLKVEGIFIEAGSVPNLTILSDFSLKRDSDGFIEVGSGGETSLKNIWAAGDITTNSDKFRQVITAAAEGAIAARSIFNSIKKNNEKTK